ncbi:hypothetical protein FOCC_FOCC014160 [Frankliniella occidentalis]|nr:hypothetical protein FOCC_FOCC014160 [Frankliniella occidentalis]
MVLDAGNSEFALGLLYVALSRVSDYKSLVLVTHLSLQRLNSSRLSSRFKVEDSAGSTTKFNHYESCSNEKFSYRKEKKERQKLYMRQYRKRMSSEAREKYREKDRLYRSHKKHKEN